MVILLPGMLDNERGLMRSEREYRITGNSDNEKYIYETKREYEVEYRPDGDTRSRLSINPRIRLGISLQAALQALPSARYPA